MLEKILRLVGFLATHNHFSLFWGENSKETLKKTTPSRMGDLDDDFPFRPLVFWGNASFCLSESSKASEIDVNFL